MDNRTNTNSANLPVVLVVDDEPSALETLQTILEQEFRVLTASGGAQAMERLRREPVNAVFLDLKLPDMDGMQILRRIKEYDENLAVVIATAIDSTRTAVEAMQAGASDYITKPFDVREVVAVARKAVAQEGLLREVVRLRSQREEVRFENIVGTSAQMQEVYAILEKVLATDATVLISGESGTGKELIARAIHFNGPRRQKSFVPINCAGIPEQLLESELFGYEKGAFTGAAAQKLGMFELANEGTLFLDEVSGLTLGMQAKLLRALEEREIKRLGGIRLIRVDVRIVAATNVDLKKAVQEGFFREDLYYRLNVVPVRLPPLRQRSGDIPLLATHFLRRYNQAFRKKIEGFTQDALECLTNYNWPGNVRELKNVIERVVALKDAGVITPKDLPFDIFIKGNMRSAVWSEGNLKEASRDFEKGYIKTVLERVQGNQAKAARILGIHRNALFNKMKSLGLKKK